MGSRYPHAGVHQGDVPRAPPHEFEQRTQAGRESGSCELLSAEDRLQPRQFDKKCYRVALEAGPVHDP